MKKSEIFKILRHHRSLAEQRDIMYNHNKAAKFAIAILSLVVISYLMFFAVLSSLIANDSHSATALEFIMAIMPFILIVDFGIRWLAQQTPSQIIKPYILLPLPRYICIDAFIFRSIFNWGNYVWLAYLIPYCIMSVVFAYGILSSLLMLLTYIILIFANSQWYAIVRTLINRNAFWWLMPLSIYAIIFSPIYINGIPTEKSFEHFANIFATLGTWIELGNISPLLIALILLALLILVNRKVQYANVMREIGKTKATKKIKHIIGFNFLEKYGEVGEYLKLEIKSLLRNLNPRKSFITATTAVILITLLCSFSEIYDNASMTNFWCLYNLVVYAAMLLVRIMGNEGNYIDMLMVHKENILSLLKAKYIFFCILILFPTLLLIPTIIMGKWSTFMIICFALFTAGFQHFIIFQLAVYNKTTIPLNTKLTSKTGVDNNYLQFITGILIFIIPMALVNIINILFTPNATFAAIGVIGLVFIATSNFWLRNIYKRMMKRRYKNLEGFRMSR